MSRWLVCTLLLSVFIGAACSVKTDQPDPAAAPSSVTPASTTFPAAPANKSPTQTPVPTEKVAAEELTPQPSATSAICTLLPAGMRLRIVPESETSFVVELVGFQAGESLVFLLVGEAEGHGARIESRPVARVDANGEYASDRFNLGTHAPIAEWQGKVIHSQGVACFDLTLPLPATPIEFGGAF